MAGGTVGTLPSRPHSRGGALPVHRTGSQRHGYRSTAALLSSAQHFKAASSRAPVLPWIWNPPWNWHGRALGPTLGALRTRLSGWGGHVTRERRRGPRHRDSSSVWHPLSPAPTVSANKGPSAPPIFLWEEAQRVLQLSPGQKLPRAQGPQGADSGPSLPLTAHPGGLREPQSLHPKSVASPPSAWRCSSRAQWPGAGARGGRSFRRAAPAPGPAQDARCTLPSCSPPQGLQGTPGGVP